MRKSAVSVRSGAGMSVHMARGGEEKRCREKERKGHCMRHYITFGKIRSRYYVKTWCFFFFNSN